MMTLPLHLRNIRILHSMNRIPHLNILNPRPSRLNIPLPINLDLALRKVSRFSSLSLRGCRPALIAQLVGIVPCLNGPYGRP